MTADATEPAAGVPNRVVVGVDGSSPSQNALRWAAFLAGATGSTIEAVTAWQPYPAYGQIGAGWVAMPTDWDPAGDARGLAETTLATVFGDDRPAGLVLTVREGSAARVLMEVSRNARMLVMGSRGHGGFAGLLLGSVSSACAEHATCPVFITHGKSTPPALHPA